MSKNHVSYQGLHILELRPLGSSSLAKDIPTPFGQIDASFVISRHPLIHPNVSKRRMQESSHFPQTRTARCRGKDTVQGL